MFAWYRERLAYFENYFANGPRWFVERNGRRVALLSECTYVDMFWYRYRVEPLSEDEEERQAVLSADFWDPDRAIAEGYVFVNCETGIPDSCGLLSGRPSPFEGYVQVRGLWWTMKYRLWPWDRFVLWVRRRLKLGENNRKRQTAAAPQPKLRWYQYRLRTLLVFVTLLCVGLGVVKIRVNQVDAQCEAIRKIASADGVFWYTNHNGYASVGDGSDPPGPKWLRSILGELYFVDHVAVTFNPEFDRENRDESRVAWLVALPRLNSVYFIDRYGLYHRNLSPALQQRLRQRFPDCKINGEPHQAAPDP